MLSTYIILYSQVNGCGVNVKNFLSAMTTKYKPVKKRPPKGQTDFGLYKKVIFIWSILHFFIQSMKGVQCGPYLQDGLY